MHENVEQFLQTSKDVSWSHISPPILVTESLGLIFWLHLHVFKFFVYVLRREKRLVGKNPLRCMRFIEAKFQLNKYATFSNQGSASAQLQSKFSTIDFLSTLLAKFLPAALHFLHFAKNEKKKKGGKQYWGRQCKLFCKVRQKESEV